MSMLITIERRASCSMFARSCKHPMMTQYFDLSAARQSRHLATHTTEHNVDRAGMSAKY